MSLKNSLRVLLLITSLCATLVAITWLKNGHMDSFWTSLGVDQGTRLNWCAERVGKLHIFKSSAQLFEENRQWLWKQDEETKTLDYLRVEKWFAQYCQVDFEQVDTPLTREAFLPIFEAQFINNERVTLYSNHNGIFRLQGRYFRSETLRQALKELLAFGSKIE